MLAHSACLDSYAHLSAKYLFVRILRGSRHLTTKYVTLTQLSETVVYADSLQHSRSLDLLVGQRDLLLCDWLYHCRGYSSLRGIDQVTFLDYPRRASLLISCFPATPRRLPNFPCLSALLALWCVALLLLGRLGDSQRVSATRRGRAMLMLLFSSPRYLTVRYRDVHPDSR